MQNDVKHYPIVGEQGLTLVKQWRDIIKNLDETILALHKATSKEIERANLSAVEDLKRIWMQMAPLAGVDAEKTWDNREWILDSRYIDIGFAVINNVPINNSLKEKESTKEEGPPPGAPIN